MTMRSLWGSGSFLAIALAAVLAACGGPGGPSLAVTADTVVTYDHSMRTPEALAEGRWSSGDIETVLIVEMAPDGRQRSEQLRTTQGGGEVPDNVRGRWNTRLLIPESGGWVLASLDHDRRGTWIDASGGDAFRMPRGAKPAGEDVVIGIPCTRWAYADDEQRIDGCYTGEGIALRYVVRMQPAVVHFEARSVVRRPIDPSRLAVPPGWFRFDGRNRPPPPTLDEALAGTPDDLLLDCRAAPRCLAAQRAFVDAWPLRTRDRAALAAVARCLTSNCEGAVRMHVALGCVYTMTLARAGGPAQPPDCWRDTDVATQSFTIDASKQLARHWFGVEAAAPPARGIR
jgi:hypothetical protein